MSQIFKAILATLAVSATFGAVQLASGHDLTGRRQLASTEPAGEINRGAKADRAALKAAQSPTETITIRSVEPRRHVGGGACSRRPGAAAQAPVMREEIRNRPEPAAKPKRTIACEPPVSVLTEVAKLLQPGRCVT